MSHKHENILKDYGIVYNNEPILFRKGTTLIRKLVPLPGDGKVHQIVFPICVDLSSEEFWRENPEILALKPLPIFKPMNNMQTYIGPNSGFPVKRQMNDANGDVIMKPHSKPETAVQNTDGKMKPFERRMPDANKQKHESMGK